MTEIERLDAASLKSDWELMRNTIVPITLDAFTWFCVLGALQLACRHPLYTGPSSDVVRTVARNIQDKIAVSERLAILLDLGWHEEFDVDPEAP